MSESLGVQWRFRATKSGHGFRARRVLGACAPRSAGAPRAHVRRVHVGCERTEFCKLFPAARRYFVQDLETPALAADPSASVAQAGPAQKQRWSKFYRRSLEGVRGCVSDP